MNKMWKMVESVQELERKKPVREICMTAVLPFLFLGCESDASDLLKLKEMNINYVLNVTPDIPGEGTVNNIHYKRIPAKDSFDQNLKQYFEESFQFIENARKTGSNILIHCHAGISRSPTIVVAYLMQSQNMSLNNAYKFVESKRPIISPNFSFIGQLHEFEKTNLNKKLPILFPLVNEIETPRRQEQTALTDIHINSIDAVINKRRIRKSSISGFTLLKPIKMRRNTLLNVT